jgi:hypothetical protein
MSNVLDWLNDSAGQLPLSHREEVAWFTEIGTKLALERDTITPEEFRKFLKILPTFFPAMKSTPKKNQRTISGILD